MLCACAGCLRAWKAVHACPNPGAHAGWLRCRGVSRATQGMGARRRALSSCAGGRSSCASKLRCAGARWVPFDAAASVRNTIRRSRSARQHHNCAAHSCTTISMPVMKLLRRWMARGCRTPPPPPPPTLCHMRKRWLLTGGQLDNVAVPRPEQLPVNAQPLAPGRGDVVLLGVLPARHPEVHAVERYCAATTCACQLGGATC